MSDVCINHADRPAVEHCEVCAEPLCGYCLWYGQDGMRLCERHARSRQTEGLQVYAPAHFAEAIEGSHEGVERHVSREVRPTWLGNQNDVLALIAATAGITSVLFFMGLSYCVPFLAGGLGLIAWFSANQSVDEPRTRKLSIVGMGGVVFAIVFWLFISMMCCAGALIPMMVGLAAGP
jgi:hypothetical protein